MSEAAGPAPAGLRAGWACALGTVLWAAFLHHGMGPSFRKGSWLEPSSFLWGEVPDQLLPAMALLVLPCAVVAGAV